METKLSGFLMWGNLCSPGNCF